jgi:c-di-GMP-binding flagellar brake protein YcgR
MIERRINPRVYESHPVFYVTNPHANRGEASTLDLSMGGLRMEAPNHMKRGERIEVSINISQQLIKCKGKVIHVLKLRDQKAKVGVRFENLSTQDRLNLAKHISYAIEIQSDARNSIRGLIIGITISFLIWAAIMYALSIFILR